MKKYVYKSMTEILFIREYYTKFIYEEYIEYNMSYDIAQRTYWTSIKFWRQLYKRTVMTHPADSASYKSFLMYKLLIINSYKK